MVVSRYSAVDFIVSVRRGTGIARHLTYCSSDTINVIQKLYAYDPDHQIIITTTKCQAREEWSSTCKNN